VFRLLASLLLIELVSIGAISTASARLTEAELNNLNQEAVVKFIEREDSLWPEVEIFALIDITPKEAIAIFSKYEEQPEYIPNLLKVSIKDHPSELDSVVEYEVDTPWPFPDPKITAVNSIKQLGNDSYAISWKVLSSTFSKEGHGSISFLSHKGRTLLHYNAVTVPDTCLSFLLKDLYKKSVVLSTRSIISRLVTLKKLPKEKLSPYLQAFELPLLARKKMVLARK